MGWIAERRGFIVVIAFKVLDFGASDGAVGVNPKNVACGGVKKSSAGVMIPSRNNALSRTGSS